MPGLTGIITSNAREQNKKDLQIMINSLLHESHYSFGSYINEDIGVYLGWACHKNSFVDCMPIWNEKKDKCLFFFGEDFSDKTIEDKLKANGHEFDSGNASYLVHLYEDRGTDFFGDLNGFFHGILIDITSKKVILFNDRFGMQRIYYYESKDALFFSAEAKSLLKIHPELREINYKSLGQLLTMRCVLEHDTIYKNIHLLPGASLWNFKNGECQKRAQYFDRHDWENQSYLEEQEFYTKLKETFISILPRYYRGTENIGVSLTGGLDTRIIMAYAPASAKTVPCYTFGSMYRDGFDVKVARKVAKLCKQRHSTIKLGDQFLVEFPDLAKKAMYISDGYLDAASGAAELFVNRKAREIAPIRMTGCHGSEVLRSISGFRYKLANQGLFHDDLMVHMAHASEIFSEKSKEHKLSFATFIEAPFFNYNRMSLEQSQIVKRTPFMDNNLLALVYRAPSKAVTSDSLSLQLVGDGNSELVKIITNRGAGGASHTFLSKWRQGYHQLLKLAEFGYDYDMPHLLSQVDNYLVPLHFEKLFLGWNGFYHFRKWFRDKLSGYVEEILLDNRTISRPYFKKGSIERIVSGHLRKGFNYGSEINTALTLELTHRALLEDI